MSSSIPEITTHPSFRLLSNDFLKPYPPYVLVDSEADAAAVLTAGCEPGYLVVLDAANALPGTKTLALNYIKEYKERIGVLVCTLPAKGDAKSQDSTPSRDLLTLASQSLSLLATSGTMIGFADPKELDVWKQACMEWAQREKVRDVEDREQDGVVLEWSAKDGREDGWLPWSVVKKAPEWAFC